MVERDGWRLSFYNGARKQALVDQDHDDHSYFYQKRVKVQEVLKKMEKAAKRRKLMKGQGLAGRCEGLGFRVHVPRWKV